MREVVSIYCSWDAEDCPPLKIQGKFSQADGAAQALKGTGALVSLPRNYKFKTVQLWDFPDVVKNG